MSTILLYPLIDCPVGCEYCFEDPNIPKNVTYNKIAMVETLKKIGNDSREGIILHGGEVLTLPNQDLEFFLKSSYDLKGVSNIQTSLSFLTSEHIRLFKEYNTNIGVSVDGPPDLNILRGPRNSEKNKEYQQNLIKNMNKLKNEQIDFGTITILSKVNAVGEKLDRLIQWAEDNKIHGRFNPMFVPFWNDNLKKYQLTPEELKTAWIKIAEASLNNHNLEWLPIREFIDNLLGCGSLSCCIVSRCDYMTTACKTIMPDGNIARCDRCFQDGYYYISDFPTYARAEILKQTECSKCKYFEICAGGCPGEGYDGDPRHKTYFCEAYYGLYEFLEKRIRGLIPNVTLSIDIDNYYEEYIKGNRINFVENMKNGTWKSSQENSKCVCKEH